MKKTMKTSPEIEALVALEKKVTILEQMMKDMEKAVETLGKIQPPTPPIFPQCPLPHCPNSQCPLPHCPNSQWQFIPCQQWPPTMLPGLPTQTWI